MDLQGYCLGFAVKKDTDPRLALGRVQVINPLTKQNPEAIGNPDLEVIGLTPRGWFIPVDGNMDCVTSIWQHLEETPG